ncbi:MAG: tRNA pseudouridine(38-40) synthase TruA [Planctomycetota bacterium]
MTTPIQTYCLVVEYDGTNYFGWQIQKNRQKTIQEALQTAIQKVTGKKVSVIGSGRTDTGVHALGQVAHFQSDTTLSPEKLLPAINHYLPSEIAIQKLMRVSEDFHARFQAKRKLYRYQIWNHPIYSPLSCQHTTWIRSKLNLERIQEASSFLVGTHDFSAFASKKDPEKSGVRTLYRADWSKVGERLIFDIEGSGFLYNMVRVIIGTLVDVGFEKKTPQKFKEILDSCSRSEAGTTAPPEGLCLVSVHYEGFEDL